MGGPDPADTPANGGSRRAAPPGNLGFDDGQRPTIHRLRQRRGPRKGPRASVTPPNRETRTPGCDGTGFFPTQPHAQHRESRNLGTVNRSPKGQQRGTPRRRKPACSGGEADTWPWRPTAVRPQGGGWQSPFLRCRPRCGTESPPGTERLPIWQGRSVGGRPSGPASRWLSIPRGTPALTVRPVHDHHPSHISTGHRRGQK